MRFLALIFIFFLCNSVQSQTFIGSARNQLTKEPVAGALITLYEIGISVETNLNGTFQLNSNLPSFINVMVEKEGYETGIYTIHLSQTDSCILYLEPSHIETDEIQIVVSRGTLHKENIAPITAKKINELNAIKTTNLGEALAKIPGVYSASSGNGISKPIIRGLGGNRVVTMLNGIRIENQQWGSDHGMAVTSLGIETVEVIKGPSSLLFGADALGGVVYFSDEKFTRTGVSEEKMGSSFETNGFNSQTTVGVKIAEKKMRLNAFAGFNSAGDFKIPTNQYVIQSRYQDRIAKLAFGYSKGIWSTNVRYTYLNSTIGIIGETADSISTPVTFLSEKPERQLIAPYQHIENHITSWENKFFFKRMKELQITLGNTHNSLNEWEEAASDSANLAMLLNSSTYAVKLKQQLRSNVKYTLGIQGMYQQNRNVPSAKERLIPNANSLDNGLFLVTDFSWHTFKIQVGIRGDIRNITIVEDTFSFNKMYQSITFSTGFMKQILKSTYRCNLSSGFRAPHTSELFANGMHEGALRYEIGSSGLKNEKANQLDLTYEYENQHLSFIINPFFSGIQNYIYLTPIDSVIEEKPVYQYVQNGSGMLYGIDMGIHVHPHPLHGLHFESTFSYVRGIQKNGNNLPFVPQPRINTMMKLPLALNKQNNSTNFVAISHSFYFAQRLVSEFETPTPHYHLVDLAINWNLGKKSEKIQLNGGIKNLFNVRYTNHLSALKNIGLAQQGRNFYLGISIKMEQKKK
jgi:iron complex outermembrane receptor protein